MPDDPQPDYFFPAAFTLGEGGNIVALESADFSSGGAQGFRLFDSEGAQSNPAWLVSEGGLDTNTVLTKRLILFTPAFLTIQPTVGEVAFYDLGNSEQWQFRAVDVVDNGATWEVTWSFVGGPPAFNRTADQVDVGSDGSASYPATAQGPSLVVPFSGTWDVLVGARTHTDATLAFTAFTLGQPPGDGSLSHELSELVPSGDRDYSEWTRYRVTLAGGGGETVAWWARSPSSTTSTPIVASYTQRTIALTPRAIVTTVTAP